MRIVNSPMIGVVVPDTADERGYDREAGARLKEWVLDRMAERGVPSVSALERDSGVSSAMIYDYFAGRMPGRDAGPRLARAVGATYREMMAARSGEMLVDPDNIAEALNRLAAAQEELTRVLAAAYGVAAPLMPSGREQQAARDEIADAEREHDARRPRPIRRPDDGGTPEPDSPPSRRKPGRR